MKKRNVLIGVGTSILAIAVVLISPLGTPVVHAVQNIFLGFSAVTDIQVGGQDVEKIVYRGETVWEREPDAPPVTISDMTYMQDLALPQNASVCNNTPDRTRTTLKDRRNNQDYYIEKIGNLCWMETNLRYAGDGNWNSTWNYPDDRYATTASNNTANTNDNTRPLSTTTSGYLGGSNTTQYQQAGYFDPNGSTTLDTINPQNNTTFYGYLYNWCSAMGGQQNACNNTSTTGFDTTQSICPAGWRLPTGGAGGEFQTMVNAVGATSNATGSTNLRNNFLAVYSGYYTNGLRNQGTLGYYWSSTVLNATSAYLLHLLATDVGPGTGNDAKSGGRAVRCIL